MLPPLVDELRYNVAQLRHDRGEVVVSILLYQLVKLSLEVLIRPRLPMRIVTTTEASLKSLQCHSIDSTWNRANIYDRLVPVVQRGLTGTYHVIRDYFCGLT